MSAVRFRGTRKGDFRFPGRVIRRLLRCIPAALLLCASGAALAQLERITNDEAAKALRAALEKGTQAAVSALGRPDGFLADGRVKIPLPEPLQRVEKLMRRVGLGGKADELIVSMNRAAEAAVPEARQLFVDAARKMTLQDAKGILAGGETAGTEYFKRSTRAPLKDRFLPIVKKMTARVGVAQQYNEYASKGAAFGLLSEDQANIDQYVTEKALDGLFLYVGEEEKKLRKDPLGAGSALLRKVFGALR